MKGKNTKTQLARIVKIHESAHRKSTKGVNRALLAQIQAFNPKAQDVSDITESFCSKFAKHLTSRLSHGSATTYLNKLHAILDHAKRLKLIKQNPMPSVKSLINSVKPTPRRHLSREELMALSNADCPHDSTKLAFLFACQTGLRLSDIETLLWSDIHCDGNTLKIIKIQVKTGNPVEVPLNSEAIRLLGERQKEGNVFPMKSRSVIANDLKLWAESAAIGKHLTFHVSRHTFATQAIAAGVDIYTVSKLCGHSSVKTTQIYVHMMDRTLQKGVDLLAQSLKETPKNKKEEPPQKVYCVVLSLCMDDLSKIISNGNILVLNKIEDILMHCRET